MTKSNSDWAILDDAILNLKYDTLQVKASSITYDNKEHMRIKRSLHAQGFKKAKYGKNEVLEKQLVDALIQFSYNRKLKRWTFTFTFDPKFNLAFSDVFIKKFLKTQVYTDVRNHTIVPVGSSEYTLDLLDMGTGFIDNLQKVVPEIREKSRYYYHFWDKNTDTFIKTYLKNAGRITRIEAKVGNQSIANIQKIILEYLKGKRKALNSEIRQEMILQTQLLETTTLGDNQEVILTALQGIVENGALLRDTLIQNFAMLSNQTNNILMDLSGHVMTLNETLSQSRERQEEIATLFLEVPNAPHEPNKFISFLGKLFSIIIRIARKVKHAFK